MGETHLAQRVTAGCRVRPWLRGCIPVSLALITMLAGCHRPSPPRVRLVEFRSQLWSMAVPQGWYQCRAADTALFGSPDGSFQIYVVAVRLGSGRTSDQIESSLLGVVGAPKGDVRRAVVAGRPTRFLSIRGKHRNYPWDIEQIVVRCPSFVLCVFFVTQANDMDGHRGLMADMIGSIVLSECLPASQRP